LVIDYDGTIEGEPFEGGKGEGVTLVLGQRGFFQEFNEALRGLIPESETDINVTFPQDHDRKDLAGKEVMFHAAVKEVKERVLPALDDEFAKDAGGCDTLEEFRGRIREQLEETQKNRADGELKWQALMTVVDRSSFELPKTAVERVAEELFMNKVRQFYAAGVPEADIREREEELRKECANDAALELKIACVEQEIAKREGLIVTDEEIEQEKTDLKETGLKGETVDEYFDVPDLRERYRIRMLRRKALDLVIEAARIKDVTTSGEEEIISRVSSEVDDEEAQTAQ
jgi:trigger factor